MTLWEFAAVMDGFRTFHGAKPKSGGDIGEDRLAELGIEGFEDGNG